MKWALQHHILKTETLPDFLILIDRNIWQGYSAEEKLALIDHELSHCSFLTEDDGVTPKFTRDGMYQWTIRGHDVECFMGEIVRNGLWTEELRDMARVIIDNLAATAEVV